MYRVGLALWATDERFWRGRFADEDHRDFTDLADYDNDHGNRASPGDGDRAYSYGDSTAAHNLSLANYSNGRRRRYGDTTTAPLANANPDRRTPDTHPCNTRADPNARPANRNAATDSHAPR